jgi:hypothetical protein
MGIKDILGKVVDESALIDESALGSAVGKAVVSALVPLLMEGLTIRATIGGVTVVAEISLGRETK